MRFFYGLILTLLLQTVLFAVTTIQNSYTYDEFHKITATDAATDDQFGSSVAISGDYAIVGAKWDDNNGSNSGSAYIYKNDGSGTFTQIANLTATDAATGDNFGYSVAISGDYVIIGVPYDDSSGSAYIFKNDGSDNFIQSSKLTASDAAADDQFGLSVAISGDYAIVGARLDDDNGTSSGSAYIFKNDGSDNYIQSSKLRASDAAADDDFGISVAISGDYAIIGAPYDDDNGYSSGSAYIFKNDGSGTFIQSSKLIASDGTTDDHFGTSVAISGDYAIIGTPYDDVFGVYSGSAYIFKNDGSGIFTQISKLTASDAELGDSFGTSVAISGNYIVVGAEADDDAGNASGSAYIFKNDGSDTFIQDNKVVVSDAAAVDKLGHSVAIDSDYAVVGASFNDDAGSNSGSAYILAHTIQGTTVENSSSFSLDIDANETISYAISGTDSALFDINATTGEISFKTAPDYEAPADAGGDNAYQFNVTANGITTSDTMAVKITVTDAFVSIQNSYSYDELQKLTASDADAWDQFGYSVATDGDYAIIGSHFDDDNGTDSGSAYIFKDNGSGSFIQIDKITASDAAAGDGFGNSVGISGDYVIVGAVSGSGSAYIFKNNGSDTFIQKSKLLASDGVAYDFFGSSVAISGDYAIIGASGDDDSGNSSGSAYIFENDGSDNFIEKIKLVASDAATDDEFGTSVGISGDYAIIGSYLDDDDGANSGSAYIFKNSGNGLFTQYAKLTATDATAGDLFGLHVAIDGDYAIVSATGHGDSGSAYIFKNTGVTFIQSSKLTASDATSDDYFGRSVAISGDYAVVGAYYEYDYDAFGSAYLFKNDGSGTFTQKSKLSSSDTSANDRFGESIGISDEYVISGVYENDDNGTGSGSASVFSILNGTINGTTVENDISFSLDIDAVEVTSFAISGTDSALFNIDTLTGEITFITAPDYEIPGDDDSDNIYLLNVTANGGASSDTAAVKIEVTDGDDTAPSMVRNSTLSLYEGATATITETTHLSATDSGVDDATLVYTITTLSSNGYVENSGNSGTPIITFTQQDLIDGVIRYAHNDSDTTSDSFIFKVSDGFNELTSQTFNISVTPVDDNPPVAPSTPDLSDASDSGVSNSDNLTNVITPTFTGTAEAGSTVKLYDGGTLLGFATATGGTWSISASALTHGVHSITATATDASSNVSAASTPLNITVDTAKPTLVQVTPVTTPTEDKTPSYTFSSNEAGSLHVNVSCGSSSEGNITTGEHTISLTQSDNSSDLSDGTYGDCTLDVTDYAGNLSDALAISSFTIQSIAPAGYSVSFDDSEITAAERATSTFSMTNAELGTTYHYTISSNRGGSDVTGNGTITEVDQLITLNDLSGLFDGTLTLSVTLTDTANNTGTVATDTTLLNAVTEGITVTLSDDTTSEGSSDNTAAFSVALMSQPEYNVDITLGSNNTAEGTVSVPVTKLLTFTPGNWDSAQDVTVVGVDDSTKDGDIAYAVTLDANSNDSEYDTKSTQVNLTNSDDDVRGINPGIIMYLLN